MAYDMQYWECGDEITAEKLNHIEEGIADASEIVEVVPLYLHRDSYPNWIASMTNEEINQIHGKVIPIVEVTTGEYHVGQMDGTGIWALDLHTQNITSGNIPVLLFTPTDIDDPSSDEWTLTDRYSITVTHLPL